MATSKVTGEGALQGATSAQIGPVQNCVVSNKRNPSTKELVSFFFHLYCSFKSHGGSKIKKNTLLVWELEKYLRFLAL